MSNDFHVPEHANFCSWCGALLRIRSGTGTDVECRVCGRKTPLTAVCGHIGEVISTLEVKPSEILRRLSGHVVEADTAADEAVVNEDCPVCKHPQLSYHTAQLRGLDEGQTIFYTCLNKDCGHKFNVNS